jgi:hypothetical protein
VSAIIVDCDAHGPRPEAFVCSHIAAGLNYRTSPGFIAYPGSDMEYPDAWCPACEVYKQEHGGDWTDEITPPGFFRLICSDCYKDAQALARNAGVLELRN